METITHAATLIQRTFAARASEAFGERLRKLEWLDDDPYEPSGEELPHLLQVALHIQDAGPADATVSVDISCAIEAQYDDSHLMLTHTMPI